MTVINDRAGDQLFRATYRITGRITFREFDPGTASGKRIFISFLPTV